jgi:catechol 2,3-dioxygenase
MSYQTRIGHVHLKVRDLDRALSFYTRHFSLRVVERIGNHYAFLTGGDMHHEIALQNVGGNAPSAPAQGVGLYHVAFEVADARSFALAYRQLQGDGVPVALVDHLISWAMYFNDPDGNGLEIYWDTRAQPNGKNAWQGQNAPLYPEQLEAVLDAEGSDDS